MPEKRPRQPRREYEVVPQKDLTYGVRVIEPNAAPSVITGFVTEAEAKSWISQRLDEQLTALRLNLAGMVKSELRKRGVSEAKIQRTGTRKRAARKPHD